MLRNNATRIGSAKKDDHTSVGAILPRLRDSFGIEKIARGRKSKLESAASIAVVFDVKKVKF
jgi:hypothetical protein